MNQSARNVRLTLLALMALAITGNVFAANNILQPSMDIFQAEFQGISSQIHGLLLNTFILLATLEFVWAMSKAFLRGGGMETFVSEMVFRLMFVGFFLYLFNQGPAIPLSILRTFQYLAGQSGVAEVQALRPDDVLDLGFKMFLNAVEHFSWTRIGMSIVAALVSVVGLVCLVIMAAHLAMTILLFYLCAHGGIILLALGGSSWTSQYAIGYLRFALSVGMRLFFMMLIVGIISKTLGDFIAAADMSTMEDIVTIMVFSLFSMVLTITVPSVVEQFMNGIAAGSGMPLLGTAGSSARASTEAVNRASTQTIGAGMAVMAAARLGASQAEASGGGMGTAAFNTARNLVGGVAKDASTRASGEARGGIFPNSGNVGGRMAARMNQARQKGNKK